MKPLETIRYACGECLVAYDVQLAPMSEWAEPDDPHAAGEIDYAPTCCPFCGSGDIKVLHDRPAR
jgi:hypothetical protein